MMRELTLEKTNKIIKDSGWNHDLFQKEIMRMPTLSGFIILMQSNSTLYDLIQIAATMKPPPVTAMRSPIKTQTLGFNSSNRLLFSYFSWSIDGS